MITVEKIIYFGLKVNLIFQYLIIMDYKEINNIYKELIKIIEKENTWSEVWIGLIIILPSLIQDIYCINLTNFYLNKFYFRKIILWL